jgi:hypothetical protein
MLVGIFNAVKVESVPLKSRNFPAVLVAPTLVEATAADAQTTPSSAALNRQLTIPEYHFGKPRHRVVATPRVRPVDADPLRRKAVYSPKEQPVGHHHGHRRRSTSD